ncbi:class I SAM-dependent methyltransferase [Salinimicrobium sp. TH3]|uniref:class I SAM-dependent methyltransferase n=1 Tax=Salinimicrobium sp. TH3 TaxID=2997342 RepID=UPI002276C4AA|nr:class I SAM-dependent methyltransferase [Salinimicrobium sp. TH3]MCY2688680.1 class I SAM-dependent methyltransferase [Salinimicrobium sp. TH3]
MKEFWNERYNSEEYVYGEVPNEYFHSRFTQFDPGEILFAAEGEGRNAVFAAKCDWKVTAFDVSTEAKKKAEKLAKKHKVELNYRVGELPDLGFEKGDFDAIALIYAHFPVEVRKKYHQLLISYLRRDGLIFFEGFSKKHKIYQDKNPGVGGPKDEALLFSMEEIKEDFGSLNFLELYEAEVDLKEGNGHDGLGAVIRFVAQKK